MPVIVKGWNGHVYGVGPQWLVDSYRALRDPVHDELIAIEKTPCPPGGRGRRGSRPVNERRVRADKINALKKRLGAIDNGFARACWWWRENGSIE